MTTPPRPSRRPDAPPGLTFLETVLASVLLGLVAMTALSSVTFVARLQKKEQRELAAAEVANRLLVIYLDELQIPWEQGELIDWPNGDRYRWAMDDSATVRLVSAVEPPSTEQARSNITLERLRLVKVRVWLSEESGGTMGFDAAVPHAYLSRLVDPLAVFRRHDAFGRIWNNPQRRAEFEAMIRGQAGRTAPPASPPGGGGGSR